MTPPIRTPKALTVRLVSSRPCGWAAHRSPGFERWGSLLPRIKSGVVERTRPVGVVVCCGLVLLLLWEMVAAPAVRAQGLGFVQVVKDVGPVDGLDGAFSVTVSPDGAHVYAAAHSDDAVAVFSRNATTGRLTWVEVHKDGANGVDGLDGAVSVTVSPDGAHIYVASDFDDAVAVFSRNATTGALMFVEALFDGVDGVVGLDGASAVTVSPDGAHVYVASIGDDTVAVFSRDATTGALTWVEVQRDGVGVVDGLDGAVSVTVSLDGKHVYATGSFDNAVAVFSRNATTGALMFVEALFDGVDGVVGLDGAHSVTISPDDVHIYVAGQFGDTVAVFSRDATTGALTWVEVQKDGIASIDGLDGASSVTVSPDGETVYVAASGDDAVAVFSRNATTGRLTWVEVHKDGANGVDGLNGAFSVTVSPDGAHVYAAAFTDDAVAVFGRNASTGTLTFVEVHKDGVASIDGLGGAVSVTVSPDGGHVYATGRDDDAVAVFNRNASTGTLTFVELEQDGVNMVDGLNAPRAVTLSPDGAHLYTAASGDHAVAVFNRLLTTGELTFVEAQQDGTGGVDGLAAAWSVAVSPDGAHLYAAGRDDDAVAVFSRNVVTGQLTFVEMQQDGVGGVDGLDDARSVTVSPDGDHVYAASRFDNAVAVFSRNAATGTLTFVEVHKDGVGGVDGLAGANSITVSPDGDHVYTAAFDDDAVAVFSRNSATGALTFVEVKQDGVSGVNGLDFAYAVTVSPDGKRVYVAGAEDDAVAVFGRNAATGALTFVEMQQDGVSGVDGLDDARSVAVSPDGDHVYATGALDDAVAVFVRLGPGTVVRYVAPTGSDTNNDCTNPGTPCLTLAHAVSQAVAGDTLSVTSGVYVEPGLVIAKALMIQGQGVVVR